MNVTNQKLDKALIGAAIGFGGMAACIALAVAMQAIQPYLPEIRGFLLWLCDPRAVLGMAFGMVVMAGIAWCVLADMEGDL